MRSLQKARHKIGATKVRLQRAFASQGNRDALLRKLGRGVWTLNTAAVDSGGLAITGWIAATDPDTELGILVNGVPCQSIGLGGDTSPMTQVFPYHRDAAHLGFHAWTPVAEEVEFAEVSVIDRRSGTPLGEWQSIFVPLQTDRYPLPDPQRRTRVHGGADEATFRLVGFSNYRKIDRALSSTIGKELSEFREVLDWGCGCGRLTRHLIAAGHAAITGADIDHDNLAWCRDHLNGARYVQVDLHPPTTLDTSRFDLVLGVSVFTHLTEAVQFEWLKEIARVLAPGGVVLASIHGPTAHAMTASPSISNRIDRRGIVDAPSYDLSGIVADGYYRTTHHTHDYIRTHWSKYFEIVDILPACIANVQDLVVMRSLGAD